MLSSSAPSTTVDPSAPSPSASSIPSVPPQLHSDEFFHEKNDSSIQPLTLQMNEIAVDTGSQSSISPSSPILSNFSSHCPRSLRVVDYFYLVTAELQEANNNES